VLEGDATPEYRICSSITNIGRGKDNHMVLRNDSVSRKHAAIHRQPDGTFIITEVDAKNGVGINGSKVAKGLLKHEDTIELGDVQLQFLEP
jgi:pSer/pThr/pTyr-binding forkhead associated (FHA) protein